MSRYLRRSLRRALRQEEHRAAHRDYDRRRPLPSFGIPDRPSGPGELIANLKRAGWTIEQIRAAYPWLFGPG